MTPYGYAHARPGAKTLPKQCRNAKDGAMGNVMFYYYQWG